MIPWPIGCATGALLASLFYHDAPFLAGWFAALSFLIGVAGIARWLVK